MPSPKTILSGTSATSGLGSTSALNAKAFSVKSGLLPPSSAGLPATVSAISRASAARLVGGPAERHAEHPGDAERVLEHVAVHPGQLDVAGVDVPEALRVPERLREQPPVVGAHRVVGVGGGAEEQGVDRRDVERRALVQEVEIGFGQLGPQPGDEDVQVAWGRTRGRPG